MTDIKDKEELFANISAYLKLVGIDTCIVYTPDGIITFGDALKLLAIYSHCDKHFHEDVMPEIVDGIDTKAVEALLKHLSEK